MSDTDSIVQFDEPPATSTWEQRSIAATMALKELCKVANGNYRSTPKEAMQIVHDARRTLVGFIRDAQVLGTTPPTEDSPA